MHYEKPSIFTLTFAEVENAKITAYLSEVIPVEGDGMGCECQCQCQCQCQSQGSGGGTLGDWWDWIKRLGGAIG